MNASLINTIEDIRNFLNPSDKVVFERCPKNADVVYVWIESFLVRFEYLLLNKTGKGLVKRYIEKLTGYSRAQVTRLVGEEGTKEFTF